MEIPSGKDYFLFFTAVKTKHQGIEARIFKEQHLVDLVMITTPEKKLINLNELVLFLKKQLESHDFFSDNRHLLEDQHIILRLLHLLLTLLWFHEIQTITINVDHHRDRNCERELQDERSPIQSIHGWLLQQENSVGELARCLRLIFPGKNPKTGDLRLISTLMYRVQDFVLKTCEKNDKEKPKFIFSTLLQDDMLGDLHENHLTSKKRKEQGIYYTPPEIVEFITYQTLSPLIDDLTSKMRQSIDTGDAAMLMTSIRAFINLKVIDPACGSGKFLMAVTRMLIQAYIKVLALFDRIDGNIAADIRRKAIQELCFQKPEWIPYLVVIRHLYGIDLDENALMTSRMNVCFQAITSFHQHVQKSMKTRFMRSILKEFITIFKISAVNFMAGDSLVGWFNESIVDDEQEKYLLSTLKKLKKQLHDRNSKIDQISKKYHETYLQAALLWDEMFTKSLEAKHISKNILQVTKPLHWPLFMKTTAISSFHAVLGNPPYFSVREISRLRPEFHVIYDYLKKSPRWKKYFRSASDIYYYFLILGIQLLQEKGRLGFIIGNYWIENDHADRLKRELLSHTLVDILVLLNGQKIFKKVNMDTCILIGTKIRRKKIAFNHVVKIFNLQEIHSIRKLLHDKSRIDGTNIRLKRIKQGQLGTGKWLLGQDEQYPSKLKIDGKKVITLGDVPPSTIEKYSFQFKLKKNEIENLIGACIVGRGIQSGCNDVFRVKVLKILDDYSILIENPKHGITARIEGSLVKAAVKNSFVKQHVFKKKEWILFIPPRINIDEYPLTKAYLQNFEHKLKQRYEYNQGKCKWYEYSVYRNLKLYDARYKIIAPYRASTNVFARDDSRTMCFDDCVIIVPRDNTREMTNSLTAILNSSAIRYWLNVAGKRKGKMFELFSTSISRIPIPKLAKTDSKHLSNIVEEIIALKSEISSKKMSHSNDLLRQESERIFHLTCKLDALVFQAFEFSRTEMTRILQRLGETNEKISMIIKYHGQ